VSDITVARLTITEMVPQSDCRNPKEDTEMRGRSVRLGTSAAVALVGLLLVSAVASAAPGAFVGAWESTDIDGSYQRLVIGGGPGASHRVLYYDNGATVCGLDPTTGEILYPALARGRGQASGDVLSGNWRVWCLSHPVTFYGDLGFEFTYHVGSDTLTDSSGVVWNRK
jgi:hypothetical protein